MALKIDPEMARKARESFLGTNRKKAAPEETQTAQPSADFSEQKAPPLYREEPAEMSEPGHEEEAKWKAAPPLYREEPEQEAPPLYREEPAEMSEPGHEEEAKRKAAPPLYREEPEQEAPPLYGEESGGLSGKVYGTGYDADRERDAEDYAGKDSGNHPLGQYGRYDMKPAPGRTGFGTGRSWTDFAEKERDTEITGSGDRSVSRTGGEKTIEKAHLGAISETGEKETDESEYTGSYVAEDEKRVYPDDVLTGYVYDFQYLRKGQAPGKLKSWMNSLFHGLPYVPDAEGFSFTLRPDRTSLDGSWQVIMYGNVVGGFPEQGKPVAVRGRVARNGNVVATKMELLLGEPVTVEIDGQRPAWFTRLCTLLILALAAGIVFSIWQGITALTNSGNMDVFTENLIALAICIGALVFVFRRIRRRFRQWRNRWFH